MEDKWSSRLTEHIPPGNKDPASLLDRGSTPARHTYHGYFPKPMEFASGRQVQHRCSLVGPAELGRNNKWVFASLPATIMSSWKDMRKLSEILESDPLVTFDVPESGISTLPVSVAYA